MSDFLEIDGIKYFLTGHGYLKERDLRYVVVIKKDSLDAEKEYFKIINEASNQFDKINDASILEELKRKHETTDDLKGIIP